MNQVAGVSGELQTRISELLRDELLILAEAVDGASVEWATRPLSDAEVRSGVRFGDIHRVQVEYLGVVEPALVDLMGAVSGLVVAEAGRAAVSASMLNMLDRWRVTPPEGLSAASARAVGVVEGALVDVFEKSSRLVVREAASQGVRLAPAVLPAQASGVGQVTGGVVRTIAHTVVNGAVDRVLDAAGRVYSTPVAVLTPPSSEVVREALAGVSVRGPLDTARQANHALVSAGRTATVEQNPPKPSRCYSSELLDGRTCPKCAAIDGTEWGSLEEAREFYPPASGYARCEGGGRCRGTLVFVWED